MFNLHHLHYFYICAQSGSVTKAANKLGISQPSLSAQIKQFERQIGMQVLIRSGRALTLTPKGRELFEYSSRVFEVTEQIERLIRKSDTVKEFDLRIAVSSEIERPFVADVLGRLMRIHNSKKMTSTIVSGPHQEVLEMLAEGQADVVISNQKIHNAQLLGELKIPVVLATASIDEPLTPKTIAHVQTTLERINRSLILPMPQMALGKETRDFLKRQGIKTFTSLQSNILACVVRAVEEGVGAAFLPIAYVNFQIKKGLIKGIGPHEGYWQHTIYVYAENEIVNPFFADLIRVMNDLNSLH